MKNEFTFSRCLVGVLIAASSTFLSCTGGKSYEDSSEVVATQPTVITGKIVCDYDNCRIRCGQAAVESSGAYGVTCSAVALQPDGNEAIATTLAAGVNLQWQNPTLLSGPAVTSSQCSLQNSSLTQTCQVRLADSSPAQMQFSANVSDPSRGSETVSDIVLLPFTIETLANGPVGLAYQALSANGAASVLSAFAIRTFDVLGIGFAGAKRLISATDSTQAINANAYQGFQNVAVDSSNVPVSTPMSLCAVGTQIYIPSGNLIYLLDGTNISLFAGSNNPNNVNELSSRLRVRLGSPTAVACASDGIYAADTINSRILKIPSAGAVQVIAGGNGYGFGGDNGPATAAQLSYPYSIAVGPDNSLYIGDIFNNRVRKVDAKSQTITTVAGNGSAGFSGDNGPATAAQLNMTQPCGIAVGADNSLYIADSANSRIRKIDAKTGIISTVAGNGEGGFSGDNGPATSAQIYFPNGIAVGLDNSLYIADTYNNRIRKVDGNAQVITTIAGNGSVGFSGDGPATAAQLNNPYGIAVGPDNSIYIGDTYNYRILKVDANTQVATTIVGGGTAGLFSGDNGPATTAQLNSPYGIAMGPDNSVYIADTYNQRIRKIDAATKVITTVAGNGQRGGSGDNGPATAAQLNYPSGIAVGSDNSLYIVDHLNNRIRKVDSKTQIITTVAGTSEGFSGDNGPATAAQLAEPYGIGVGPDNSLYIADTGNRRIRKIDANTQVITTIVGNGSPGASGDNGPATAALLNRPVGVAVGPGPDYPLYIVDSLNDSIRKVTGGIISSLVITQSASTPTVTNPLTITVVGSEIYFGDANGLRLLKPDPNGNAQYILSTLFAPNMVKDCSMSLIQQQATAQQIDQTLQVSLSSLCAGTVTAVSANDTCAAGGSQGALVFSQLFIDNHVDSILQPATGSDVIKITRPCPTQ